MYNKGDNSTLDQPNVMPLEVLEQTLAKISDYRSERSTPPPIIVLHGGEPLLVGKKWMRQALWMIKNQSGLRDARIAIQTNAILIDREWIEIFESHNVHVGVSIDGPQEIHDRYRVNKGGRGTYRQVRKGVDLLVEASQAKKVSLGALCVANPEYDPVEIYNHFTEIGLKQLDFLWPDFTHDDPPPWPAGQLGDYFIRLFDEWYNQADPSITIRWFLSSMLLLLGEDTLMEGIGGGAVSSVAVETNGELQPLDTLRIAGNAFTKVGTSVRTHGISDLRSTDLFRQCLEADQAMPTKCRSCTFRRTCGGGYLPHRYGRGRNFANESVHCEDIFAVLHHVHQIISRELAELSA